MVFVTVEGMIGGSPYQYSQITTYYYLSPLPSNYLCIYRQGVSLCYVVAATNIP